ncbi:uncharacterized protein KY384_007786 [Bacidia gigantensis]|uniref:uncharacterized protein n=1 Tax=Bacidia gigantensis TaxID=2732470 RepID=UPI001D03FE79|nr:uncharacterized protein KY384_007786 [Bacidia gigantensis]KAG8527633.1 hypothetical protein KY384_007786 [Bacidia gigantensis]
MSSLPNTMKGVLVCKEGGPEVLEYRTDLPVPSPKECEVLVKNSVIGINYIDTYFRTGLYKAPKPEILGKDGAGKIASLGPGVTGFVENDPVVWMHTGGYAEYTVAPAERTAKIPKEISEEDACAAVLQGLTALSLIDEAHKVNAGDWVLVTAASGGVGGWLCQLLRARGAHTIATVGSQAKVNDARKLGAEKVVVEQEVGDEGVKQVVQEKTGGRGVVAVFDSIGKITFDRSLECVARKGTLVSYGNSSGAVEPFSISRLAAKNVKVTRPTLFNYIYTREEFEQYLDELWRLMTKEKFTVRIHQKYPLAEVAQAHRDLESRKTMGKLLMVP